MLTVAYVRQQLRSRVRLACAIQAERYRRLQGVGHPPRHALSAPEAALFVGVSETMFRELVEEGVMPKPRQIQSRVLWDADELILAFKSLPRQARGSNQPLKGGKIW